MLELILEDAINAEDKSFGLRKREKKFLSRVSGAACFGRNKAVLAVVATLLLKKIETPEQDIRLHQDRMDGGFSGRGLDTRIVTPFLRAEKFPHMASGSGWLTRSFEQARPYDLDYPGRISPPKVKDAFLAVVDEVEKGLDPKACLMFLFRSLADWRENNSEIALSKPTGRRILEIVSLVEDHWNSNLPGVAKLPVLAVYAAYKCFIKEVEKYRDCKLIELRSHTSADSRDAMLGDIQVVDRNGNPFEVVEVKHSMQITLAMLQQMNEKLRGGGAKTFLVLSTNERMKESELNDIAKELRDLRIGYGCQVILNGVKTSLKYYLRLMKDTDEFIHEYVRMVEADSEITFELKRRWNTIVGEQRNDA